MVRWQVGRDKVYRELVISGQYSDMLVELRRRLEGVGLRVQQSFDLHCALTNGPHCHCPYHGTERCDCQYGVLLAYGQGTGPATLLVHGRDELFWLTVTSAPSSPSTRDLESAIVQALAGLELADANEQSN